MELKRFKNGFTLVELIIVLAIIALLAVLVLAYFRGQIFKGNDAKRKGDLDRIKIALEEYEKDHNCYPSTVTNPTILNCNPGTGLQPYLDKVPCDPTGNVPYYYEFDQSGSGVCPGWYRLYTKLENPADANAMPFCGPFNSFNYYVSSPNAPECISSTETPPSGGVIPGGGTPAPGGDGTTRQYGCKNGVCVPIEWDSSNSRWACGASYQDVNCYGTCMVNGVPANPCTPWH